MLFDGFEDGRPYPRTLSVEEAKTLSTDELRQRVGDIIEMNWDIWMPHALPEGFPVASQIKTMSRDEIMAVYEKFGRWIEPANCPAPEVIDDAEYPFDDLDLSVRH